MVPNPSIERTCNNRLRLLSPPLMSNVRQHEMRRVTRLVSLLAALLGACNGPPNPVPTFEMLTVSPNQFELRGTVYGSTQELVAALRTQRPKVERVAIRWVAAASKPAQKPATLTSVAEAQAALQEAGIRVVGVVGNEVFLPSQSASSTPQ